MASEGLNGSARRIIIMSAAMLACSAFVPVANADGPSEIYLGKRTGSINVTGGVNKYRFTDKQYRSTSLPNLRKHLIRITYKDCSIGWKARAAVKKGNRVVTVEAKTEGCNKSVLLTPSGNMKANVTLTIHQLSGGVSRSTSIKPVR
jgi:hypothetical protein